MSHAVTMEAGFQQAAPSPTQMHLPTFHSRKGTVTNTQINGAFIANAACRQIHIEEESRHEVGTDHDRVAVRAWVERGGPAEGCCGRAEGCEERPSRR